MPENNLFGQRLRIFRKRAGLTQGELAELIGISEITIRRWELDQRQPRMEEIKKLAEVLHVSETELCNDDVNNSFGARLRALRKRAGLTQEQLAEAVGVHINNVSRWEKDEFIPKTLKIKAIAEALGVPETVLLNGQPEDLQSSGWVLTVKIAHSFSEEVIDMSRNIPRKASITTTPEGGYLCLGGDYSLWTDNDNFKKFIADIKKFRNTVIQNGIALGGIKG